MSTYTKIVSNEEVEERNRKNKSVMKGCSSLDLNQSLEETDLQLNSFPQSVIKLNSPPATEPQHEIREGEPEYGCSFCPKKFSNKQALGGHQNAHKLEKVGQKRGRQGQDANFAYNGNRFNNGFNSFPFPNSFDQVPKMIQSTHYSQYIEHQGNAYEYPPGSVFPMSHESGTVQPFMGFGGFCPIPKHSPKPQMQARDYPGSMFSMSHEHVVPQPSMGNGSVCTNLENPPSMSYGRRMGDMGQGASTSKGKSPALVMNDEADHHKQISNTEIQHREDDLDLSLKL